MNAEVGTSLDYEVRNLKIKLKKKQKERFLNVLLFKIKKKI